MDEPLELGIELPFEVKVTKLPYQEQDSSDPRVLLHTTELALVVETLVARDQLPDDALRERGETVVEDILLLVSFAMRTWVTWYQRRMRVPGLHETRIRRIRRTLSEREPAYNDVVVDPRQVRDFLRTAYPLFCQLRDDGLDLTTVLQTTLTSLEEKYLEAQFLSLFTALEALKNFHADIKGTNFVLPSEEFENLEKPLRAVVKKEVDSKEARRELYAKLRGLNRRSLRTVIEEMFKEYNTDWSDLYPGESSVTLLSTRNALVHAGKRPNDDTVIRDFVRLQAVIERLLLRMLGWKDISQSPSPLDMKWLHRPRKHTDGEAHT